jgi:hypothetical protein
MKPSLLYAFVLLSTVTTSTLLAQMTPERRALLKPDSTIAIPKIKIDANGELIIVSSSTSSKTDFDFLIGKWKMYHRRLNKRLENCKEWTEFESLDDDHKILQGMGNVDSYYSNQLPGMEGKDFEGFTLRLFNPKTKLWSLYWVPSTTGILDTPVIGSFENNIGHFFGKDTFNGKKIIFMFRWDIRNKEKPVWGQAFTADNGKTWEWNWFNVLERMN